MCAMSNIVTVAIPTMNAGPGFVESLAAIAGQRLDQELELLICDSGSIDGTVDRAREYGARVIEIRRRTFSHGATRNLLMSQARGDHVAFLTQDAVPAHPGWLQALVEAFSLGDDVGLAFGPYVPRPDSSPSVTREIVDWFASFPTGEARIARLDPAQRGAPDLDFLGHLGFFSDVNGCVARAAWQRVPFRAVAYAEDHRLALDMLRAGYAKVYVPEAPVIHAHEYSRWDWMRRSFDESRAMREVYGWAPDARTVIRDVRGGVMADLRAARRSPGADREGGGRVSGREQLAAAVAAAGHHSARGLGTFLGPRSAPWPRFLVRRLSLEGRA